MKKMKIISACLAVSMSIMSLCGCGNNDDKNAVDLDPNNPVTVTVWHYYNGVQQTIFDEMVKEFNNTVGSEKGIIVEAYSKSSINELADSVINAVDNTGTSETPPDIFATYAETAYTLDKLGKLADLNQYINNETDEYVKEYIDEGIFSDNSFKIFPTAKSTEIMIINKTDWDKFASAENIDESALGTMEGVVETAEKYYNYTDALTPDIPDDGKAFFGRDSVANYMYVGAKQLGSDYFETDDKGNTNIVISKDALKKLWENYYVPYVKGYFTAENRFRSDDAKTGAIISLVCSTSGAAYFPTEVTLNDDSSYKIENLVLPVPGFADGEQYIVQQGAGMSVIKSNEKVEYASLIFLEWFTEEERNIKFSISSGYLPVKKSANDFSKIDKINSELDEPVNEILLNSINTAIEESKTRKFYTSPPFDKSAETRDYIGDTMQNTASDDYAEVQKRISDGEDREKVLDEYTNSDAFENWYNNFISGLENVLQ